MAKDKYIRSILVVSVGACSAALVLCYVAITIYIERHPESFAQGLEFRKQHEIYVTITTICAAYTHYVKKKGVSPNSINDLVDSGLIHYTVENGNECKYDLIHVNDHTIIVGDDGHNRVEYNMRNDVYSFYENRLLIKEIREGRLEVIPR